jgi:hypothetical protein
MLTPLVLAVALSGQHRGAAGGGVQTGGHVAAGGGVQNGGRAAAGGSVHSSGRAAAGGSVHSGGHAAAGGSVHNGGRVAAGGSVHNGGHVAAGGSVHNRGHVAGSAVGHRGGASTAAVEHQIARDVVKRQQAMREHHDRHEAMVKKDLPRLEAHLKERMYERRHWEDLRRHHHRLGPEAFWRLALRHREIDSLLAALREEKAELRYDSTAARLARVKARHEMWDNLAESRFNAYFEERTFDRRYWDSLRFYHERLGSDTFWRLAHENNEIDQFRVALSTELRLELSDALAEGPAPVSAPVSAPREVAKQSPGGLIEISPNEYKQGKTTDDPSSPGKGGE